VEEPGFLDQSCTLIVDTFLGVYAAAKIRLPAQNCFICSAIWASIGHSVGAAVGAAIPGAKRPVVICGDGGFQMIVQALSTRSRQKEDVVVIVVDNSIDGYEQYPLDRSYYTHSAQAPLPYAILPSWDHERHPVFLLPGCLDTFSSLSAVGARQRPAPLPALHFL
jgi:indolepyruvate decarboxylase